MDRHCGRAGSKGRAVERSIAGPRPAIKSSADAATSSIVQLKSDFRVKPPPAGVLSVLTARAPHRKCVGPRSGEQLGRVLLRRACQDSILPNKRSVRTCRGGSGLARSGCRVVATTERRPGDLPGSAHGHDSGQEPRCPTRGFRPFATHGEPNTVMSPRSSMSMGSDVCMALKDPHCLSRDGVLR